MRFGVDLGRCNPRLWLDLARAADELGYESVWLPEHLVFPAFIDESPAPGSAHGRVDPHVPTYDPFVMLAAIAIPETIEVRSALPPPHRDVRSRRRDRIGRMRPNQPCPLVPNNASPSLAT